jgi:broad specificity phosphatase PhoE
MVELIGQGRGLGQNYCEIYLFRHGNSRSNASRDRSLPLSGLFSSLRETFGYETALTLIQRFDALRGKFTPFEVPDHDIPLTKVGRQQARQTGIELARQMILPDFILVSSYRRTIETAEGILAGIKEVTGQDLAYLVLKTDLIIERSSGQTSGFPKAYYRVLFPEVDSQFRTTDKVDFRPPGGESIHDVRFNRLPPLLDLLGKVNFTRLFVVGHGLTNTCIRSLLTGEDIRKIRVGSPNLGVYHFTRIERETLWTLDPKLDGSQSISDKIPLTI